MLSLEHLETPAFLVDVLPDGGFVYRDGNGPLKQRTGLGRRLKAGMSPRDLLPASFACIVVAHYEHCVRSNAVVEFEERTDVEGRTTHWRTTLVPMKDAASHAVTQLLGLVIDVTASKCAALDQLRTNARLNLALQAVQGAHWEYEVQSNRFLASPALALLLGDKEPRPVELAEWVGRIPAADRPSASFHALVEGACEEQSTRFRVVTGRGDERWLRCRRVAVRDAGRAVQMIFGVTVDVTDEVREEQRLTHEAQHDGLTRLLNRRGFLARLDAMRRECEGSSVPLTVLMLDLDHFKSTNDTRGHAAGDAVLATVGQRIEAVLRPQDCAARLGGDEFAIAVLGRDPVRARQLVDRLRQALQRPCPFRGDSIPISVSIGEAAWLPGHAAAATMEAADQALYAEKRHKRLLDRRRVGPLLRWSA